MKNLIIILLLAVTTSQAQTDHKWFVKYSNDLSMTIGDETYNAEYTLGIEFENTRFSIALETHKAIGYKKYSWLQVDYKRELFKNVYGYVGLEGSVIYRKEGDLYFSKTTWLNIGANAEIQYNIYDNLYIGANFNYFRSESTLIKYGKKMRYDVMATVTFKM